MAFFTVGAVELCQLFHWRDLCFSPNEAVSLLWWEVPVASVLLPTAIVLHVMMVLGLRFRWTAIATYFVTRTVIQSCDLSYHFDGIMTNVAFVFLFMPRPQCLSIDSWLQGSARQDGAGAWIPASSAILLFLAIELVYFDSLFFKLESRLWLDGLAFWMPSALPHLSTGLLPDWAELPWLMRSASYMALVTEAIFPLVLFRRFRHLICGLAIVLHLGIVIFFPIPLFGLGMCALLLAFVDWDELLPWLPRSTADVAAPHGAWYARAVALVMLVSQLGLISETAIPSDSAAAVRWVQNNRQLSQWMGLTRHAVYVDRHFAIRTPLLRWQTEVNGTLVEIPTFDVQGYPRYPWVSGRIWVFHYWGMRRDNVNFATLESRWATFLARWFRKQRLPAGEVSVLWKPVETPLVENYQLDDTIERTPWQHGGWITIFAGQDRWFRTAWEPRFVAGVTEAISSGRDQP